MLCCAQPCQCVLSQTIANPRSRGVTPNRPTFAQRWQWGLDHANSALACAPLCFAIFMWNRALARVSCIFCRPHLSKMLQTCLLCKPSSRYSLAHILPTWSSKSAPNDSFLFSFWNANWALATILCAFCRQLLQIENHTRGNRDPTSATPGATLPEKNTGLLCGWHNDKTAPGCSSITRKCSNLTSLGPQRKNMQKFEIEEPPDLSKGQGKWVKGVTL